MDNKIDSFESLGKVFYKEEGVQVAVSPDDIKRGTIFMADIQDLATGTIHITQKTRPVLIIQNDVGNNYAPTIIVAMITGAEKKDYPMHYHYTRDIKTSTIMFEQILTLDKCRLMYKMTSLSPKEMAEAEEKLMHSLELNRFSLNNVLDIDVIHRNTIKTRKEEYTTFLIHILCKTGILKTNISIDKLKQFNNTINEDIDFDELKNKLDNCKGLNWLVTNNTIEKSI